MKQRLENAFAGLVSFVRVGIDKVLDAIDVVADILRGRPNDPRKVSVEFAQALRQPVEKVVAADNEVTYKINPALKPEEFKVNFELVTETDKPLLNINFETPRLVGYSIGTGTAEEQAADLKFMAEQLYGDSRVARTYATGILYNAHAALEAATKRFNMFSGRANDIANPQAFRGFMVKSKATGERIGVINAGGNGFGLAAGVAEPAMMLKRSEQRKGFGTELGVLGMFYYLPEVIKSSFKTPAGADFEALAATARPNNKLPARLGLEPVDPTTVGATREETTDKYGKDSRNFYHVAKPRFQ